MISKSDVLGARVDPWSACDGNGCIVVAEHLGLLEDGVEIELLEHIPAVHDVLCTVSECLVLCFGARQILPLVKLRSPADRSSGEIRDGARRRQALVLVAGPVGVSEIDEL